MYSDLSITAANESIKNGTSTLYVDATGSVVKKVNDKKIFYYCGVIKEQSGISTPVLEFLTDTHNTFNIIRPILAFKHHLTLKPKRIELYFSWAIIHAALLSFNAMDIHSYLQKSYAGKMANVTVIHICCAHMLRTFQKNLKVILKPTKQQSELMMRVFALLQNTTDTKEAQHLWRHICNVFGTRTKTTNMVTSLNTIEGMVASCSTSALDEEEHTIPESK